MHDVSIIKCGSYEYDEVKAAVKAAVEAVGGLDFLKKGDRVAIKANLVSPKSPDKAATTHPSMVKALCELIAERGATAIVGDSPGGVFGFAALSHCYAACGMNEILETGAELNNDFSKRTVNFFQAKRAKEFLYTAWLDSADYIIDLCKLKTHGMFGLSAATKNMFGVVPGTTKPEYHYLYKDARDFSDMIVDLCEFTKPVLSLVDAVYGMEGNGPNNGTPRFVGAVIAAKKPYYADLLIEKIIPFKSRPATTAAAVERGLCPGDLGELSVFGDPARFFVPDYELVDVESIDFSHTRPRALIALARGVFAHRPVLVPEKCVGCKECARICPAKAITIKNGKPVIDRKKCVRCFCCQEFCPKGALKVKRTAIARIING